MRSIVKHLMIPLALFAFNLAFSTPALADFRFQQGAFSISASLKDTSTTPAKITPLFTLRGSALWTIDLANYSRESGQITIQRRTFTCDEAYSYSNDYRCEIDSTKFQQLLDDLVIHDPEFLEAQDLIKRYYDKTYYWDKFKINLGKLNQNTEATDRKVLTDPANAKRSVEFEIKNYGMRDL